MRRERERERKNPKETKRNTEKGSTKLETYHIHVHHDNEHIHALVQRHRRRGWVPIRLLRLLLLLWYDGIRSSRRVRSRSRIGIGIVRRTSLRHAILSLPNLLLFQLVLLLLQLLIVSLEHGGGILIIQLWLWW